MEFVKEVKVSINAMAKPCKNEDLRVTAFEEDLFDFCKQRAKCACCIYVWQLLRDC